MDFTQPNSIVATMRSDAVARPTRTHQGFAGMVSSACFVLSEPFPLFHGEVGVVGPCRGSCELLGHSGRGSPQLPSRANALGGPCKPTSPREAERGSLPPLHLHHQSSPLCLAPTFCSGIVVGAMSQVHANVFECTVVSSLRSAWAVRSSEPIV